MPPNSVRVAEQCGRHLILFVLVRLSVYMAVSTVITVYSLNIIEMVQPFPDNFKPVLETDFQIFLFENNFKTVFPEIFCLFASVILLIYGVVRR